MDPIDIKPAGLVAGIDDSDQALSVARVAVRLASQLGLGLTLVHIAHHEKHYLVGEKRLDVLEGGLRLLRGVVRQAGLRGHARLRVGLGDPAPELLT
jgi:nucleotide-binding universal stress UspA family protein